jgi:hypothetical protein
LDVVFHTIGEQHGFAVHHGPFSGMSYLSQVQADDLLRGSAFVPKLVGSYEAELADVISRLPVTGYDRVVNVGCGEGYYAVGLARLLPQAHVFAFDIDQPSQDWCTQMARQNEVADRVTISGACTLNDLRELTARRALLFVDCEGAELDLLQPTALPGLEHCDVLVEFHDFINPAISSTLLSRFAPTHALSVISSRERNPAEYSVLQGLDAMDQHLAVDEFRPVGMQWAFMAAKQPGTSAN